jgi:uncharacterized membrane protein YozB (DUF420 family)
MTIPAFSIFSAVSELFVTAGVIYVVRRNWTRRAFPLAVFLVIALFEAFVNVFYMTTKSAQVASGLSTIAPGMKLFYAGHGILSLLAYLIFVTLGVLAWQEQRAGRYFFRERPAVTWSFAVVWAISIVSGETIFALHYLV